MPERALDVPARCDHAEALMSTRDTLIDLALGLTAAVVALFVLYMVW